jgi:nickel-dependent lactate racemase
MILKLQFGAQSHELMVSVERFLPVEQPVSSRSHDPAHLLREALESPTDYPALRLALTPDDHVAVVIDPGLPQLDVLLTVLVEHLATAGVQSETVTLVLADEPTNPNWRALLGPWQNRLGLEIHDPRDRDKLSYLAATQKGRRIYINRTVVDADQVVVLARAGYDWARGYTGAGTAIFPALSDEATRQEFAAITESLTDGGAAEVFSTEAAEAAWLLGAPFFIQVIEGVGDAIATIVTGATDSLNESHKQLDAVWQLSEHRQASLVIAQVTGSPDRLNLQDLAGAAAKAANFIDGAGVLAIVFPGQIVLDEAMQVVCQASDPVDAVKRLRRQKAPNSGAALQWLAAVGRARVYLLSPAASETVEEMHAAPLDRLDQLQKLVDAAPSAILLVDPQKIVTGPAHATAPSKAGARKGRSRRS